MRLAGCGLTAVPAALLRIPTLTALDLSANSLSYLPLPPPPPPPPTHGLVPAGSQLAASWANGTAASHSHSHSRASAASPTRLQPQPGGGGGGGGGWGVAPVAAPAPPAHGGPGGSSALTPSSAAAAAAVAAAGGPLAAAFAGGLVRLNIATNRFTAWPAGLAGCTALRELVLGAPLVARAADTGELERCVVALMPRHRPKATAAAAAQAGSKEPQTTAGDGPPPPGAAGGCLERLEVRGASFEPRAVRALLAVQRLAAAAGGGLSVQAREL